MSVEFNQGTALSEKEDDDVGIDLTAINIVLIIDRNVEKEVMISKILPRMWFW